MKPAETPAFLWVGPRANVNRIAHKNGNRYRLTIAHNM
jgi:hypothetical protein